MSPTTCKANRGSVGRRLALVCLAGALGVATACQPKEPEPCVCPEPETALESETSETASTPTEKPTPNPCRQIVLNPGFEETRVWTFGPTPRQARYSTANHYTGQRSVLMGIMPYESDILSYSSIWQAIHIPADATSAKLSFWYWPATQGHDPNDWQASWIFDDSLNFPPLEQVLPIQSNTQTWLPGEHDLFGFRGQTITLYFTAVNDGEGNRRTWWFLDDVTVEVCGSSSQTIIPAQPQEGPGLRQLLSLLNQSPNVTPR